MAQPTLQQQIQPLTQQQAFQILLAYYQLAGFPTTAWEQFGADIARNQAFATAISDTVTNYIPAIAGGTLLDYAPNFPGWTALTAQQIYNLLQNGATFTQGNILATNVSGNAYSYSPSAPLIFTFQASLNRYFSVGSGTIPANGTLTIPVQAELAGASYADPSNSAGLVLATQLPGVTLTNPSTNYTTVTHVGTGSGLVTPGGIPTPPHSVIITILSTGQSGVATWSYSIDAAIPVNAGTATSLTIGDGIVITLSNGATSPSFVQGDAYSFSTPAPWITSQGANAETDLALAQRCRNRLSSLSNIPTQGYYQLLAQSNPTVGSQVTQVFVLPDFIVNNRVNVLVAGPGGVLPAPTITTLQTWLTQHARGCDNPVVQSPTTTPVVIGATILAVAGQIPTAQGAVQTALDNYIASIQINGTIRLSTIVELIMQVPGVIDVLGVTINSLAQNLVLGNSSSFVLPAFPPTLNLTYNGQ